MQASQPTSRDFLVVVVVVVVVVDGGGGGGGASLFYVHIYWFISCTLIIPPNTVPNCVARQGRCIEAASPSETGDTGKSCERAEDAGEFLRSGGKSRVFGGDLDRDNTKQGSESDLSIRVNDLVLGAEYV